MTEVRDHKAAVRAAKLFVISHSLVTASTEPEPGQGARFVEWLDNAASEVLDALDRIDAQDYEQQLERKEKSHGRSLRL